MSNSKNAISNVTTNKLNKDLNYSDILSGSSKSAVVNLFGISHYKYDDCSLSDLTTVDSFRIHKEAAIAFKEMKSVAKKEGIKLKVVSGYRSSKYQIQVFKKKFNGKYPSASQLKARLMYSAPAGYSEHHTGLAIDINSTEDYFKDTKEYKWLLANAKDFGFEISFPENNAQNLGFEPWHWRYIGKNGEYKHIFSHARKNDPRYLAEYN